MTWLFIYVLAISLYDLRTGRIPNWYTLPVIVAGLVAHFPGYPDLWFAGFTLLIAWAGHWMGAGDAKLWLAALWSLPIELSSHLLFLMFVSYFLTGLAQILWRIARKQSPTKLLTPGAWRIIPFILLSWYVH